MRFVLVFSVLGATMVSLSPALAQDRAFYVGAEVGAASFSDAEFEFTPGTVAGTTGRLDADLGLGFNGALFVGYDFGRIRIEVEAQRGRTPINEVTTSGLNVPGQTSSGTFGASGDVETTSYMLNAAIDVATVRGFELFAGAGVGRTQVSVSGAAAGGGDILDDEETEGGGDRSQRTTWQVFAGFRKPLSDRIHAHVRYRFMTANQPDNGDGFIGYSGRFVALEDLSSHTLNAGLTFRF